MSERRKSKFYEWKWIFDRQLRYAWLLLKCTGCEGCEGFVEEINIIILWKVGFCDNLNKGHLSHYKITFNCRLQRPSFSPKIISFSQFTLSNHLFHPPQRSQNSKIQFLHANLVRKFACSESGHQIRLQAIIIENPGWHNLCSLWPDFHKYLWEILK